MDIEKIKKRMKWNYSGCSGNPLILSGITKEDFDFLLAEVERLKEELSEVKRTYPQMWFDKGIDSVKRKNESGCCCRFNEDEEIDSPCGAHIEWRDKELAALKEENERKDESIAQWKCNNAENKLIAEENHRRAARAEVELTTLKEGLIAYRKMLWVRHGHRLADLYGDDGELQCHACMPHWDYKRESFVDLLDHVLTLLTTRAEKAEQEVERKNGLIREKDAELTKLVHEIELQGRRILGDEEVDRLIKEAEEGVCPLVKATKGRGE